MPLLKNDTKNIIVYKDDLEEFNKKRKKRVWEKLITNLMYRKAIIFGIRGYYLS